MLLLFTNKPPSESVQKPDIRGGFITVYFYNVLIDWRISCLHGTL